MKTGAYSTVAFLCTALLLSCSSGESAKTATDSTVIAPDSSVTPPVLKPFEPDDNYIALTEIVSQYGPSGIIRDVVVAQNGIIWMAAWDGVVSYNPETKQFTNHTLKDGLSHHRVYSVMEDSKGNIWFGTMGAGVYKYDGSRFTNLSTNSGMVHNVIFDLFEDSKGNIWFGTTAGVSRYNGNGFMNITDEDSLSGEVYAISEDRYGIVWIGGADGLFRYDPSANGKKVTEILTEHDTHYANVRDLYWNGFMYAGCARGLYRWTVNGMQVTELSTTFTSYVTGTLNDDLLLTTDGLYRYDTDAREAYGPQSDRNTEIAKGGRDINIFGAREAKDGTIWYGAMDGLHSVREGKDFSYKKP